MGNLKPGAQYIYESPDEGKTIFAREVGSNERVLVGYHFAPSEKEKRIGVWEDILKTAETNPALQNAIDQVLVIYGLAKNKETHEEFHVRV